MGKPPAVNLQEPAMNQIVVGGEPPELKHLSRARKRNQKRLTEALSSESTSLSLLQKKLTMYLEN